MSVLGTLANKAFGNMTAIPRKLGIIPKEMKTPQGAIDVVRGKTKPQGSSLLGRPLTQLGRTSRSLLG